MTKRCTLISELPELQIVTEDPTVKTPQDVEDTFWGNHGLGLPNTDVVPRSTRKPKPGADKSN